MWMSRILQNAAQTQGSNNADGAGLKQGIISVEDYIKVRGHAPMAPLFIRRPIVPFYSKVMNWTYRSVTFTSVFLGLHLACLLPGLVAVRIKKIMRMRSEKKRLLSEEETFWLAESPIRSRAQYLEEEESIKANKGYLLSWQKNYYRKIIYT